jgi:hypothetical protein
MRSKMIGIAGMLIVPGIMKGRGEAQKFRTKRHSAQLPETMAASFRKSALEQLAQR